MTRWVGGGGGLGGDRYVTPHARRQTQNDNGICGSSRTFHLGLAGEGYLLCLEHAIMEKL